MPFPRRSLMALPAVAACASPLPEVAAPAGFSQPGQLSAVALLAATATAHGADSFRVIADINVSYAGEWAPIIGRLQPALTDQGFRIRSEERLLPRQAFVAQHHEGPSGRKHVVRSGSWRPGGDVRVAFNGVESTDAEQRAAAALVADGYALFLLGPLAVMGVEWTAAEAARPERIPVGGRDHWCDVLRGRAAPGLGFAASDRLALFVDREERLTPCRGAAVHGRLDEDLLNLLN